MNFFSEQAFKFLYFFHSPVFSNMNSPRSIQSPRNTSPKEVTHFVYLYKIEFPDDRPKKIKIPKTMNDLLKTATKVLELQRPARQVYEDFTDLSNPITEISQINPKSKLYVSCANVSQKDDIDIDSEYINKSRLPRASTASSLSMKRAKSPSKSNVISRSSSPSRSKSTTPQKREDVEQQCTIAACSTSVKENIRDAILSLYNSLTPDHKSLLSMSETLKKLTSDTQISVIENTLLNNYIGPSSNVLNSTTGIETQAWMADQLKGLMPHECRFAVTGPSQSGKSTVLSMGVSLFYQKLQLTGESPNYLLFPLNWRLQQICLDDVSKLYSLFITTTLKMLRNSRMELIPIIVPLKQWFLSLITQQVLPPLPPQIIHYTTFPHDAIAEIGRSIHNKWSNRDGFREFLREIVNFPISIAKSFGFVSVVYIFDHFDNCGYEISPTEHFQSDNLVNGSTPVVLSELICEAIEKTPFFVASQNDIDFFNLFSVEDYHQLSTERIIQLPQEASSQSPSRSPSQLKSQNPQNGATVTITSSNASITSSRSKSAQLNEMYLQQPPIVLSLENCRGCPAYVAMYERVYEIAENVQRANAESKKKSISQSVKLRPATEKSRNQLLKQEFIRLCTLLAAADTDGVFSEDNMNQLMKVKEIVIQTR